MLLMHWAIFVFISLMTITGGVIGLAIGWIFSLYRCQTSAHGHAISACDLPPVLTAAIIGAVASFLGAVFMIAFHYQVLRWFEEVWQSTDRFIHVRLLRKPYPAPVPWNFRDRAIKYDKHLGQRDHDVVYCLEWLHRGVLPRLENSLVPSDYRSASELVKSWVVNRNVPGWQEKRLIDLAVFTKAIMLVLYLTDIDLFGRLFNSENHMISCPWPDPGPSGHGVAPLKWSSLSVASPAYKVDSSHDPRVHSPASSSTESVSPNAKSSLSRQD